MGKFVIGALAALCVPGGLIGGAAVVAAQWWLGRGDNRVVIVPRTRTMATPRVMLTVMR